MRKPAYAIEFDSCTELLNAMNKMYSLGFVFTTFRYKDAPQNHYDPTLWRYIIVGHKTDSPCKMIMNTTPHKDNFGKSIDVSFDKFINEIFPNW
jgi:hypothetical protein